MRGIEATDTTYTALISAYAKAERLEDALATYKIMASTTSCFLSLSICAYVYVYGGTLKASMTVHAIL